MANAKDSDFGKFFPCACTDESRKNVLARHFLESSRLASEMIERFTFDSWRDKINIGCNEAFSAARAFAEQSTVIPWLFMGGVYGLGKTHLCIAAIGHLAKSGVDAVYYSGPDLALELKNAVGESRVSQLIHRLSTVSALCIDDLGAERSTEFIETEFHTILDKRYVEGKRTIITLNPQIVKIPPRLNSRLNDTRMVVRIDMEGTDARGRL